jgi:hypothetical protein
MMASHVSRAIASAIQVLLLLFIGIVFVAPGVSATADETTQAKKILAEALEAIGGPEKAAGWSTRTEVGLYRTSWPGWGDLQAKTTRQVKKPDKVKIDNDFSMYDHPFFMTYYANGEDAWYAVNLNSRRNPRVADAMQEFLERLDGIAFYLSACDTFFLEREVLDDSLVLGSSVSRIGCILRGDSTLFDIDVATSLPTRSITESGTRHMLYSDYRDVEGLLVPFHVTLYENGSKSEEFIWEEVLFDSHIDDAVFEEFRPPAPVEAE